MKRKHNMMFVSVGMY